MKKKHHQQQFQDIPVFHCLTANVDHQWWIAVVGKKVTSERAIL